MLIVADENIAEVRQHFGGLGELVLAPGRRIDNLMVRDADVLLVRSVTRVDAALLQNSRCRFVGTATSGIDHVDTAYLDARGITFAAARGCNADAVTDYVCSALAALAMQSGQNWAQQSIGIVGCGEVGSRLAMRCLALGMQVAIHDPFLPQAHKLQQHCIGYPAVLQSDIVTFHTPLTAVGGHPTWHMLGNEEFTLLAPTAIVINAARGAVVDNEALLNWLIRNPDARAVLDVWEGEPQILPGLLEKVALGTAHIAGYTVEGKLRGTRMIRNSLGEFLQLPVHENNEVMTTGPKLSGNDLNALVLAAYDIRRDDEALRQVAGRADTDQAFDHLRKFYPPRREFSSCAVETASLEPALAKQAAALGFRSG
jgi:erythronate-4-phosphate dehydrogenase